MIGDKTLARPYAKAAFEVACETSTLNDWQVALDNAAAIVSHPDLHHLVASPDIDMHEICNLLLDLLKLSNDDIVNFIKVLAGAKRLSVLPEISALFEEHKDQFESEISVEITSSKALSEQEKVMFAKALEKKFSRKVDIENTVDESLLGGAVIRAGDLVIDGSGVNALAKLKNYLKGNQVCN